MHIERFARGLQAINSLQYLSVIIIAAVISLGAGIAVGATFVANMIDANTLREYQQSPKIVGFVTLNDDIDENNAGWNPTRGDNGGSDTFLYTIKDQSVKEEYLVYATVIGKQHFERIPDGQESFIAMNVPCYTMPFDGGFTAYCDYKEYSALTGSQLRYIVIAPS